MGLFSFLGGGAGADVGEEVSREISFVEAVRAHVAWKSKLARVLDGTGEERLDPASACRDDRCVLGKWIHGPGEMRFGRDETFSDLKAAHAIFHIHAAEILIKAGMGKMDEAREIFEGPYADTSHKVVGILAELGRNSKKR